jgi:quinol monooxygenase YgiN
MADSAASPAGTARVFAATIVARAGEEDALGAVLGEAVGPCRAEPGALIYELSRSDVDPGRFFLYEVFRDADAHAAHSAAAHSRRVAESEAFKNATIDVVEYGLLDGTPPGRPEELA